MADESWGPLSPEEQDRIAAYYGGTPGVNMSVAPAGPPASASSFAPPQPPPQPPPTPPVDMRTPEEKAIDDYYAPYQVQPTGAGMGNPASKDAIVPNPDLPFSPPPVTPTSKPREPVAYARDMASGVPTGPTERDNREFDIYKAKLESSQKAAAPRTGAGGPSKLQKNVDEANRHLLGTYDDERALALRSGQVKSAHDVMIAERQGELARLQEDDAWAARAEEADAQGRFDEQLKQVSQQLDDVRAQKIDPMKWKEGKGIGFDFLMVLGAVGAGMYQAVHGGENQFIKELNTVIDRSISTQEKDIRQQRDAAGDQLNLLGQQRSIYKDHQVAELQARNLFFESAKTKLLEDAAHSDVELEKVESEQKAKAIEREQATLQKAIAERALATAQAQAAAAGAQARAARKEAIETQLKLIEFGLKEKEIEAKNAGKTSEQSQKLGEALAKPELIEAKQTIADIKSKLMKTGPDGRSEYDLDRGVPGVGAGADLRSSWGMNPIAGPLKNTPPLGLDNEERIGRQEWMRLALAYKHAVTGAGGSDKEAGIIESAFAGANTPAEQANAVRLADESLARRESRIKAGFDSPTVRQYEDREGEEHDRATATVPRKSVR